MDSYRLRPDGPFSLANERRFFGDWLSVPSDPEAVAMAFPVEGWRGSAAVVDAPNWLEPLLPQHDIVPSVRMPQASVCPQATVAHDVAETSVGIRRLDVPERRS